MKITKEQAIDSIIQQAKIIEEIERLTNIINKIKKLDLYISEEDYDYEENLINNYIPFNIEEFINNEIQP